MSKLKPFQLDDPNFSIKEPERTAEPKSCQYCDSEHVLETCGYENEDWHTDRCETCMVFIIVHLEERAEKAEAKVEELDIVACEQEVMIVDLQDEARRIKAYHAPLFYERMMKDIAKEKLMEGTEQRCLKDGMRTVGPGVHG